MPQSDEERLVLARRLVVDRCLYGVDKNRLAVEMAKLSLWLITLDKNRPFTFLDHSLRHGDSLIGADDEMFLRWAHNLRDSSMPLFDEEMRRLVEEARKKRQQLQGFEVRDVRDAKRKARLLAEAEAATERIKLGCNLLVGARMLPELTKTEREALLANGLIDFTAGEVFSDPVAQKAVKVAREQPAFHWPFEFPEVFGEGGFSAFVGNPPFLGGSRISTNLGTYYYHALRSNYATLHGQADLCAVFFLRGHALLQPGATLGLIATNTIAQGDTREAGLEEIVGKSGVVYFADSDVAWPGSAAVHVNVVHIHSGKYGGQRILDGEKVEHISPMLDTLATLGSPNKLRQNENEAFAGSYVLGMGFILEPDEALKLIQKDKKNTDVLFPYLNGRDLNSQPDQSPTRWVIYFRDWSREVAETYEDCFRIVRQRVYPERKHKKNKQQREIWWQYKRPTVELYNQIESLSQVLVCSNVSAHLALSFVPTNYLLNVNLCVFVTDRWVDFLLLQNSLHEIWARQFSSTLETRLKYSVVDAYGTYPFPELDKSDQRSLNYLGEQYHRHRNQLMLGRQEGLTATYNRFHEPDEGPHDIVSLRKLHAEMDIAVAHAYGWEDLDLAHDFHETDQGIRFTINDRARRQVLTRLLKLNHERYEEEVRQGLHEGKSRKGAKARRKGKEKRGEGQLSLF